MEISDILKLTHELVQLRDDRLHMSFEDDRSQLCRSLEQANKKIERLTKCLKSASDDYDTLMKTVLNVTSSNGTRKRNAEETLVKPITKVRISDKPCLSPVKPASPQKSHVHNQLTSSMKKSVDASPVKSLFSSPIASSVNEECSPESVDCLNPGSAMAPPLELVKPVKVVPSSSSAKTVASAGVSSTREPIQSSRIIAAPLVMQSKQSSSKSENVTASRSSSVQVSTSSSSSASMRPPLKPKDFNYQSLDLVESKHSKKAPRVVNEIETVVATTTSVKLQRSSSVMTSSSSSSYSINVAKKDGGTNSLARASTVNSHDRRSENYKCVDVVRKRAERDALPGHTCFECEAFYEAMIQQGVMTEESRKEHLRQCSRHKAKFTPPTTPEGFWDLTIHTPEEWK